MDNMSEKKLVSIIIPVHNEALNIAPLHEELTKTLRKLAYDFEIVYVDDGSTDDSSKILYELTAKNINIHVIQFSRNFGKEAAVSAGLHAAKGDAAIIIDADMQMPPSLMKEFIARWEQGAEVVVGVFSARSMQLARRVGAKIFYSIMQTIGHTKITPHATDYRLLDRQVIDTFNDFTERNRITRGLIDWLGFERDYVYFEQAPRLHGKPSYKFSDLIALAVNSLTAYSLVPLRMAGYLGVFILTVTIPLGILLYIERFIMHDPFGWGVSGTFFLAVLILALVGLILACLGLISIYIAHIHTEVIDRPLYVVRRKPKAKDLSTADSTAEEKILEKELDISEGALEG